MRTQTIGGVVLLCACALLMATPIWAQDLEPTATPLTMCDDRGRVWSISVAACKPAIPGGNGTLCISGYRDIYNVNNCGNASGQPLDGSYTLLLNTFSTTAFKIYGNSNCMSTHWTGVVQKGSSPLTIKGNVSSEQGPYDTFTLSVCSGVASATTAKDPALR